jgi:signal transduction histidine kinase
MFRKIINQLMLSYMAVLIAILGVFILAVRLTFVRSLNGQLEDKLKALAVVGVTGLEIEDGELEAEDEDILVDEDRAIQWFDTEGNLIEEQGEVTLKLPFDSEQVYQIQKTPYPAKGLIVPVNDKKTGQFIGYTRVSVSMIDLQNDLRNLDSGLATGTMVALLLGGIGNIWLTRQAMQPIERSFHKLQQFTSDASHELRSPLMAIKANAAVALKYPEGMRKMDKEKFQAINSASTQLTSLTEKLLFLARNDQKLTYKQDKIDLRVVLEELLQLYGPVAQTENIVLKSDIGDRLEVYGDEVQLKLLFTNLLDNALRYTSAQGRVEIRAKKTQDKIIVSISDTGIGIAPEHLGQIFSRFWQADKARSRSGAGTRSHQSVGFGLGLAIAESVAKNHGGLIEVASELGKGSCFTVSLSNAVISETFISKPV